MSNLTNSSATLNGSGNPNRAATTGWFRYATTNPGTCDDKFGSRAPVTGGLALGSDIVDQLYSQSIPGLSSGTTYYYCAIVASTEGTAFGAVLTFTTAGAATATTAAATSATATTATLNGSASPNGATATAWFRYSPTNPGTCSDTFGLRAPTSSGTNLGAGSVSVPFGQAITGLAPGVTYYYCAIANNTYGTGFGAVLSFTTPASPPTVSTDYPTGITTTLNGSANPNGAATTGWFRIATSSPGTCNDTFGTRLPTTAGTVLGAGSSFVAYANPAAGLVPGTTYYYCAIASNALGTSFGVIRVFTAPMPPTVATLAATPVTATTATLNGSANPNGNATTGWFRYSTSSPGTCNDVFGTRTPTTGGLPLGSDVVAATYSQAITGLSPGTTFYFCAIATSAYGTSLGAVLSFTTPVSVAGIPTAPAGQAAAPATPVVTVAATAVASDSAVLNATANPNGTATTGWFRYDTTDPKTCSDSFGTRAPTNGGTPLGTGSRPVAYSETLTGLVPGTTYYYCAVALSGVKVGYGTVLSLTTKAAAPSVTTTPPTEVVEDSAVLNGSVIANGDATTGWFRYSPINPGSCNDSFGVRAAAGSGQGLGAGVTAAAYSVAVVGLTHGTTYYYCALATNSEGTTFGEVVSFVPGANSTLVVTDPATNIDETSAIIVGSVTGPATKVWFRYGEFDPGVCDDAFGSRAAATSDPALGIEATSNAYAAMLTGLKPNVTYYYCAAASNQNGAKFGQVRSFTVAATQVVMGTVTSTIGTAAPQNQSGCTYSTRSGGSPLALLTMLPLLGLLLVRRRQRQS